MYVPTSAGSDRRDASVVHTLIRSAIHFSLCALNSASDTPTPLVVRHVPVPLTCGVFDASIITDPSLLEEELLTTHVTVVSTADGKVRIGFRAFLIVTCTTAAVQPRSVVNAP